MPEHYSLAGHAWLPVALASGQRAFVRPCDITSKIDGQTIIRVATGRPDCDISLTEFLIGLLAVSFGPESPRDWLKRYRTSPSRDELVAALAPFEPALILDGDGPRFFQDLEALEGEPGGISGLLIDAPGANTIKDNADHFVKRGRTGMLSRAGAAIVLATLQTSAPSGGAGHRTSLRGGGPLSTLVLPGARDAGEPSLWERLWANVPETMRADPEAAMRIFPWLTPTRVSDKAGVATTPEDVSPAQAFFGMPRRIRLVFEPNPEKRPCDLLGVIDDVVVTGYVTRPWGTNYTAWGGFHPLSPHYRMKKDAAELLPLHLQSSRVGYRQWLGLVMKTQDGLRLPARCVSDFYARAVSFTGDDAAVLRGARLLAAGYAMDNMKPLDFGEALMPLIITADATSNASIGQQAEAFIRAAETIANQLLNSIKLALYGERAKADRDSAVLEPVRSRFWADTEQDFYRELKAAAERIESHADDPQDHLAENAQQSGQAWRQALERASLRIFDDTVPIDSAESSKLEDVIAGRRFLVNALRGFGAVGGGLFKQLSLPPVETKAKKGRKAA